MEVGQDPNWGCSVKEKRKQKYFLCKFHRNTIFWSLQFADMDLYFNHKLKIGVRAEYVRKNCALILEGQNGFLFAVVSVTKLRCLGDATRAHAGQKVSPEWEKGESEFHFLSWEVIGKPVFTPATAAQPFPYIAAIYIAYRG
jgi:hypothetical protein